MPITVARSGAYPANHSVNAKTDTPASQGAEPPPSTGMGKDMVRGLALMFIAAVMAALVLATERLLLDRVDVGNVLGWLVLWSVLLSALLLLSRVSVRVSQTALDWLDRVASSRAQARSRARFSVEAN